MKRLAFVLALTGSVQAALAAEPFVGTWSAGSSVGLPRCSTDDDGKLILRSDSEAGYEHYCKFTKKQPAGGNAWRIQSQCEGTGERWSKNAIVTVENKDRLVYQPTVEGKTQKIVYNRCAN